MTYKQNTGDDTLTRREREKLQHRREIMDAATRVFALKGFFNATLDEVAQEAEFSKGTLYLYFSSKEDLLYEIIQDKSETFSELIHRCVKGERTFREELEDLYKSFAEYSFEFEDFFTIIMAHHANKYRVFSGDRSVELNEMHSRFFAFADQKIAEAQDTGELRKDINPQSIRGVIHGALDNLLMTRWECETLEQLKMNIESFMDILFNGIAERKEAAQ